MRNELGLAGHSDDRYEIVVYLAASEYMRKSNTTVQLLEQLRRNDQESNPALIVESTPGEFLFFFLFCFHIYIFLFFLKFDLLI